MKIYQIYHHFKGVESFDSKVNYIRFLEMIIKYFYIQEARLPGSNYSVAYVGQTLPDEIIAKYETQAENLKAKS